MKTRTKKQIIMAVVAALMLWAAAGWAGEGMQCGKDDPERFEHAQKIDKIVDELGLSAAQKDQIKKQRSDFAAKAKEAKEKMRTTRAALKEELDKQTVDTARVNGLVAELKNQVGQQIQNRVDSVLAMKQVLTPEQFNKMKTLMEERRKDHMGRKAYKPRR